MMRAAAPATVGRAADGRSDPDDVTVYVATMDGRIEAANYPDGRYALRVYNQGVPSGSPAFAQVINLEGRGLAASRNAALRDARPGIFVVTDNDVRFVPGFERAIRAAYAARPDADMILFSIRTPSGRPFGRYPTSDRRVGMLDVLHRCSIEITFRAESIARAGLRFDERFGLGSTWRTGEDVVFLRDAVGAGLSVWSSPHVIAEHPEASSGAAHDAPMLSAKGAMLTRMYGPLGVPMAIAYALRKRRTCVPPMPPVRAALAALQGAARFGRMRTR